MMVRMGDFPDGVRSGKVEASIGGAAGGKVHSAAKIPLHYNALKFCSTCLSVLG